MLRKRVLLLQSHLISESQKEKGKMNVPWFRNVSQIRKSVCSVVESHIMKPKYVFCKLQ